jgi:hypothetical protein
MEKSVSTMLERHRKLINFAIKEEAEKFTPYDTHDMRKVLESQKVFQYGLATFKERTTRDRKLRVAYVLIIYVCRIS